MSAKLLDGKALSQSIQTEIAAAVVTRLESGLSRPGLAVILVGEDAASLTYVGHKQRACEAAGFHSPYFHLPADTTQQALEDLIVQCNQDASIHGILLQLPLPEHLDGEHFLELIDPKKDVDGFHPYNIGRLALRQQGLRPCTPAGVMSLLSTTGVVLEGQHAVVVGASNIVGRPMALELLLARCTVSVCHRFSHEIAPLIRMADILIVAIGKPGIVKSEWIKPGAIVIDIGITRMDDGLLHGDIEFDSAKDIASWITPVPGGVGPMTVATLLQNTLIAAELQ